MFGIKVKKQTKKLISVLLCFVFIFSSALSVLAADEISYKLYAYNFNNVPKSEIKSDNPLVVWIGGGKSVYELGNTGIKVDFNSKSIPVELLASDGSELINITKGKNCYWLTATGSDAVGKTFSPKPKNSNDYISVSAGKITAKKLPTPDGKTAYVGLYTYDKKKKIYTCIATFPVVVKQAPSKLLAYKKQDSIVASDKITTIDVGLNTSSDTIYIQPLNSKNTKVGISTDSLTYRIEPNNKNVSIIYDSDGSPVEARAGEAITINADSSGALSFKIKGLELVKGRDSDRGTVEYQDKPATSTVTVTNMQSGKNVKLKATVNNNVIGINSDGINNFNLEMVVHGAITTLPSRTMNLLSDGTGANTVNYITLNDSSGTVTVKPTVGVYAKKSEGEYTYSDFINSSTQKLAFPSANKSSDAAVELVGKSNYHIKISAKKKTNYAEDKELYAVIAYGPSEDQILILPFKLKSPDIELQSLKISSTELVVNKALEDSSGVYVHSDVIQLGESISSRGVSIVTTPVETTTILPAIAVTNGTYSTTSKKLTVADDKQALIKVSYKSHDYYFTVNGCDYTPKPLTEIVVDKKSTGLKYNSDGTIITAPDKITSDGANGITVKTSSYYETESDGIEVLIKNDKGQISNYLSEIKLVTSAGSNARFDRSKSLLYGMAINEEVTLEVTQYYYSNRSKSIYKKYSIVVQRVNDPVAG